MELERGYKKTDVGVIPEDWEARKLSAVCSMKSGEGITAVKIDEFSQYPCYGGNGLRGRTCRYTHDGIFALIGRQGALCGNVIGVRGKFFASEHAVVVAALKGTDICFLTFVLSKMGLNRYSESSAQPGLSVSKILQLPIAIPQTEAEQHAIAVALSDVDNLLDSLDRLIAKKRDLKQAVMQQLLTGKTRLPGFEEEWEIVQIGSLGTFSKGQGIRKDEASSGDISCVRYGEIYTHHNDVIRSFNSKISTSVAKTSKRLKKGDLLFAGSGETKEEIGKCVAFVADEEAYAGGDIVILSPIKGNSIFFGYLFNTTIIARQKANKGQGDAVVHISSAALASIEIQLPPEPEQQAIASVLSDMDSEFTALENRRIKTRDLKQAMMQELLTGKTRLLSPKGSYA